MQGNTWNFSMEGFEISETELHSKFHKKSLSCFGNSTGESLAKHKKKKQLQKSKRPKALQVGKKYTYVYGKTKS